MVGVSTSSAFIWTTAAAGFRRHSVSTSVGNTSLRDSSTVIVVCSTALPAGAQFALPFDKSTHSSHSPLQERLESLTFNYEDEEPPVGKSVRYRCQYGHVVTSVRGSPACRTCPTCAAQCCVPKANTSRRKLSLCSLRALANERGGTLLSTTYKDARTPLLWRCRHGHMWKANACNVRSAQSWCPECARLAKKLSIEDMQEVAARMGGECLSKYYISNSVKLEWRCAKGHVFHMAPNNIMRSKDGKRKPSWCKLCREEAVRKKTTGKRLADSSVSQK